VTLSEKEVGALLDAPGTDTVLGLRDRAILAVLYGTGIRASECSGLREQDLDLSDDQPTIRVTGKGGHQRTVPLNARVLAALTLYRTARGPRSATQGVFESRRHRSMSRGAIYERVRHWSQHAKIAKTISPHRLRHTFATHLVRAGVKLVTIRDLLGHRSICSTQIYLHVTAMDLREAADRHPIQRLAPMVMQLLPTAKLPIQHPPWRRATG
jgi:site-specific recombinase XerD